MKMNFKSILKLTCSIFFIGLLQSCFSNCNEIKLSPKNKLWLKPYTKTEFVIFKSNKNSLDTFHLKDSYTDYTTCSKFELGPNIYNYAGIRFESKQKIKTFKRHFSVSLDKNYSNESTDECSIILSVFDLDSRFDSNEDSLFVFEHIKNPYTGKAYHALKFNRGDRFTSTPSYITSYLWDQKEGLISYELSSGEIFYLIDKH